MKQRKGRRMTVPRVMGRWYDAKDTEGESKINNNYYYCYLFAWIFTMYYERIKNTKKMIQRLLFLKLTFKCIYQDRYCHEVEINL